MSKKDKVSFVRTNDFEAVEEELNSALTLLDETNERVGELLSREHGQLEIPGVAQPAEAPQASAAEEVPAPAN